MAKFRKKPVVIEAFRLNERGLVAEDWFWDAVTRNDIITHCFGKYEPDPAWCEIKTLEGTMIANAGDYIIQGVHGEIYSCKADIFQKTYTEENPKTNADCIRAMSDEEFADWIAKTQIDNVATVLEIVGIPWEQPPGLRELTAKDNLEWLKQPAEKQKEEA